LSSTTYNLSMARGINVIHQASTKLQRFINKHVDDNLGITNDFLSHLAAQVTKILAHCRAPGSARRFVTLCSQNELTKTLAGRIKNMSHAAMIVNLDGGVDVSGHFVTILFTPTKTIYIDSFGRALTNRHLTRFIHMARGKRPIMENTDAIQDVSSKFCGLFALAFSAVFEVGLNPITTLLWHTRSDHLLRNDTLCAEYVTHLFSECKRQREKN